MSKSIADEIVDEIADLISKVVRENKTVLKRNLVEIGKIRRRIADLENRVEKYVKSFKITATETERHITAESEELARRNEQNILNLVGQIEDLRTAMVRLSAEVKNMKDAVEKLKKD